MGACSLEGVCHTDMRSAPFKSDVKADMPITLTTRFDKMLDVPPNSQTTTTIILELQENLDL